MRDFRGTDKLRALVDVVQTGVRGLDALGVSSIRYGVLLISVLKKAVPVDICLDYCRRKMREQKRARNSNNVFGS